MNPNHDAPIALTSPPYTPIQTLIWQERWPDMAAALIGIVMVAAVGFAPGLAHNAAHDVRHTVAFPCH